MTQRPTLSDDELRNDVEAALHAALPSVAAHVGVGVADGSVLLTGRLARRSDWELARAAVLTVAGVHSLADDIAVGEPHPPGETDADLAALAQAALRTAPGIAADTVIAEVRRHVVTLRGTVPTTGERLAAERAVIHLPGLTRIVNRIRIAAPSP